MNAHAMLVQCRPEQEEAAIMTDTASMGKPVAELHSANKPKTRMEEIWERWHSESLNIDPVRFREDIDRGIDTTPGGQFPPFCVNESQTSTF